MTDPAPTPGAASELLRKLRDCDIGDAFKREIDAVLAAPVTEGAQREAVAFPREPTIAMLILLNSGIDGAKKWKCLVEAQDSLPKTPPPPGRVQPERVEADWKAAQLSARPEIERESVAYAAPPTDASGGVTEEHPFDAIDDCITEFTNMGCNGYARDLHVARTKLDRRIRELEAADRARKPGYRQPNYDDIPKFRAALEIALTKVDNDGAVIRAMKEIGAVIPDAGQPA